MTRAVVGLVLSVLVLSSISSAQEGDPGVEYKNRRENIGKMIAGKHYGVGEYLSGQSMHAWARDQYNIAIQWDPNNEGARKRLGDRKGDDGNWEVDPDAKIQTRNMKTKEEEVIKVKTEYEKKLADAGKSISSEWLAIGNLAEKANLKTEAEDCYRKAIEYNANNESARKKLKHEKTKEGLWVSPADKALRAELEAGLAKAPSGAEDKGTSEVGGKLGVTLVRRSSEHFLVESAYLDQKALGGLVQHMEHAYAMFHKMFNQSNLFTDKYNIIYLKDKAQHEKYVDAYHQGSPVEKDFAKKSSGTGGYPRGECYTGDRPISSNEDHAVHYPIQALVGATAGYQALWLLEGTALWFSARIKHTAFWACVDLAGTGTGQGGKDMRDPKDWAFAIKNWLKEGKDPAIEALIKCTKWSELDGLETVKAWSIVDFLLTEHREKFIEFMQNQKSQKDTGEAALKAVFGWSLQDLDIKWKAWARAAYESAK